VFIKERSKENFDFSTFISEINVIDVEIGILILLKTENKGLYDLSTKLQRAGENSLHGMDRANSSNTNSPKDTNIPNIKIPISTCITLISDTKVEKKNISFDLSLTKTDFNIAQHNRKKKEFAKNQEEWDIQKNAIKNSLNIETIISSEQNFTGNMNINDRVNRLNMLS